MSIKKYAKGNVYNKITFLKIVKNFGESDLAADFNEELEGLAKDCIVNVRIACAETVNAMKDDVWANAKNILMMDDDKEVIGKFGKFVKAYHSRDFVTPPLLRKSHREDIGVVIKISHSSLGKFVKIYNFYEVQSLIK